MSNHEYYSENVWWRLLHTTVFIIWGRACHSYTSNATTINNMLQCMYAVVHQYRFEPALEKDILTRVIKQDKNIWET